MQNTELTFPPGVEYGDEQCLGIPLIDNNRADGTRVFTVSIVSFDPLVRVVPEYSQKIVYNDGKLFCYLATCCKMGGILHANSLNKRKQNHSKDTKHILRQALLYINLAFMLSAGTQVEFQRSDYLVAENAGVVEVCVVLVGNTLVNESGTVSVRTQDGSATGRLLENICEVL